MLRRSARAPAYRITDAHQGLGSDVHQREMRYVIAMGIRTACLLLAIFVPVTPLRVVFIVFAVTLPYFAVVAANAGRRRREETLSASTRLEGHGAVRVDAVPVNIMPASDGTRDDTGR